MVFINPEIIRLSRKKHDMSEGCLSVRGKYGVVERHEKASVKAQGQDGKTFTYDVGTQVESASRISQVLGAWPRPGQT